MCKYRLKQKEGSIALWSIDKKVFGLFWREIDEVIAKELEEAEEYLKERYLDRKVSKEYEC